MENKSEKFQQNKFTSYGGDKGNELKSEWPAKNEKDIPNLMFDEYGQLTREAGMCNGLACKSDDDFIHHFSFEVQAKYWKEKYKALLDKEENMIDIETGD